MHEQEIKIQSAGAELIATLCLPNKVGKFPAVLMVHGSGPMDRNENMKGQQLNIFNAIAHALAGSGIASLRYDKRGCGESSGSFIRAGHADLVQDAARCLDALAQSEGVSESQLFVLGHSEGCIIAAQLSQLRPSVSGLVLLCPFIEKIESVLIRQAAQLEQEIDSLPGVTGYLYRALFRVIGKPCATQQRLIGKVRASDRPVVRSGLSRHPAKWLRELMQLNPESIFSSTRAPMLLIGGKTDLQCKPDDAARIAEVAPGDTEVLLVEDMTHLLRKDKAPASMLGAAHLLHQPVEPTVIEKTAQWIGSSAG